jgi:hypothetical protein
MTWDARRVHRRDCSMSKEKREEKETKRLGGGFHGQGLPTLSACSRES